MRSKSFIIGCIPLLIVPICNHARASACDQQIKCFSVCEEFTTIGSPECKSACSPAIAICEKEKSKQTSNKQPPSNPVKAIPSVKQIKQGVTECAWNGNYEGELYCKDFSPGLVNYNSVCSIHPQDTPLRRQLSQYGTVISRCTPEVYDKGLNNTNSKGYRFRPAGFIPPGMTALNPNVR